MRSQITSDTSRKLHICKKCSTHFTKQDLFEKHLLYCSKNETVAVKMPTKNSILKFQNHFKKLPIPFAVYADFECFTLPVNSCQPNPDKSYTQGYQKHEPSGYCLYLKGLDGIDANFKPIVYTKKTEDEDISKKFIKHVVKLTFMIYKTFYSKPKPLNLTSQEEKDFQSATICHICEQDLFKDKETGKILKIRDHCHFTGEYRGAAHNECNLKCKKTLILPVILHNLQGYEFQEICLVFLQLKKNTFHFPKKLYLINTFPVRWENYFPKNSKYASLILSSFFRLHSTISFQILNHQISKI